MNCVILESGLSPIDMELPWEVVFLLATRTNGCSASTSFESI